jgi:hypothetical protein
MTKMTVTAMTTAGDSKTSGEADQIHLVRFDRAVDRHHGLQREKGQKGAAQHLDHARHDPPGPAISTARPTTDAVFPRLLGQEAKVIDLFTDLHHQCDGDGRGGTEHQPVEFTLPPDASPVRPVNSPNSCGACSQTATYGSTSSTSQTGCVHSWITADQRHAVDHQRNHHHCAQQIAPAEAAGRNTFRSPAP